MKPIYRLNRYYKIPSYVASLSQQEETEPFILSNPNGSKIAIIEKVHGISGSHNYDSQTSHPGWRT